MYCSPTKRQLEPISLILKLSSIQSPNVLNCSISILSLFNTDIGLIHRGRPNVFNVSIGVRSLGGRAFKFRGI